MKRSNLIAFGFAGLVAAVAAQMACSPIGRRGTDQCDGVFENGECLDDSTTGNGGSGGSGQTSSNGSGGDGGDIFIPPTGSGGGGVGGGASCATDPNVDDDGDGATENQGDCNDCDANVGPGAIEVATDPNDPMAQQSDEDCDGTVDNVASTCDDNLAFDNLEAANGVRAVDICNFVNPGELKWGVLSTMYVRSNGAPASPGTQAGLLSDFGPNVKPQGGTRMLALASGTARLPNQPDACGASSCPGIGSGTPPPGFPQDPPSCPVSTSIYDDVGLEVRMRAPTNATGYKFSFKFYSFEYPEWVCQTYNDQFISLVNPAPLGSINGNISFDSQTNPVSVNVAFFDVCQGCPLGTGELQGTGFDTWNDAGATGWLQSQAPVKGGQEFIIRWAIWDTGDSAYDSTALVDNFEWIASGGTVVVGTTPIPDPK
ncbi:MAG: choice-of-anchor L domain-containing protein [Polyangiaceae bacterium]|nr:choice-of-anchor L domain-containing protein [Polyangiaceae bacterium]